MPSNISILPVNVDDLLRCRGVESERVEFKASWDPATTGPQMLRTICAFANDYHNLNGGYLVVGVREHEGRAALPPVGLSAEQVEAAQKWIRGNCNRLDPPYRPILSPERLQDRLVLVVWAPASDMRPHRAPAAEGKAARYWIRLGNETVDAEGHRRGDLLRGLIAQTARVPWDDRAARTARVEDMREGKVREFLHDVRSGLLDEPDGREIFRRMGLVTRINDHEVPRNIGLLFFSNDPTEWFRGAKIEVVRFAADRAGDVQEERTFGGSLLDQARDCLAYLENRSVFHLQKQRNDIRAKTWVAYPTAALREALMNALYHRSYDLDQPEPTKVYIFPSRVEIISYPGPVPGIQSAHLMPNAKVIRAAPARNRRIGEFLKELGLAEGRLSGLPKIYAEMAANGSPAPSFDFDEQRTYFQATFPAHPQYAAVSAVRDAAHLRALGNRQDAYHRLQTALAANRRSPDASAMLHEMAAMRASRDSNSDGESEPPLAWGVDGCPGGWFYVALDATGEWCCGLVDSLREIVERAGGQDRVFVDIPIGLPDEGNPEPRQCDLEARWLLNRDQQSGKPLPDGERRGGSVFPAPARETLDAENYREACNLNKDVTSKRTSDKKGVGLSRQAFALIPRIREANELLCQSDNVLKDKVRKIVCEVHPELCFWALNGKHPMKHNKKQLRGRDERLAVLQSYWPNAKFAPIWGKICELYPRKQVAYDDIADAMVAAVTARGDPSQRVPTNPLPPADPPRDTKGLPMQMIWAAKEAIHIENRQSSSGNVRKGNYEEKSMPNFVKRTLTKTDVGKSQTHRAAIRLKEKEAIRIFPEHLGKERPYEFCCEDHAGRRWKLKYTNKASGPRIRLIEGYLNCYSIRPGDTITIRSPESEGSPYRIFYSAQGDGARLPKEKVHGGYAEGNSGSIKANRPARMVRASMKMEEFAELIPEELKGEQGRVFYSGRSAFEKPSHLYILGFNPAGSWEGTISEHTDWILKEAPHSWSSYEEKGAKSRMRPRMLHLFEKLGIAPGDVPASNLIFKSSPRESELKNRDQLAEACWPFHQAVIDDLGVSVVLCLGGGSGKRVRKWLNTGRKVVDYFEEDNDRKWKSYVHRNDDGLKVVTLTHPSIVDWTSPDSDPTHLVVKAIRGDYD